MELWCGVTTFLMIRMLLSGTVLWSYLMKVICFWLWNCNVELELLLYMCCLLAEHLLCLHTIIYFIRSHLKSNTVASLVLLTPKDPIICIFDKGKDCSSVYVDCRALSISSDFWLRWLVYYSPCGVQRNQMVYRNTVARHGRIISCLVSCSRFSHPYFLKKQPRHVSVQRGW